MLGGRGAPSPLSPSHLSTSGECVGMKCIIIEGPLCVIHVAMSLFLLLNKLMLTFSSFNF